MLMYECVAGAPAFTATTTAAILRGHIREPVVPPSHRRGEAIPPVLEAAILKCLEKEPKDRFRSGDEVVAALRADRAVQLVTPRFEPARAGRKSRVLQSLPAFGMMAAAAVIHFLPHPPQATASPDRVVATVPAPLPPPAPAPAAATIDVALTTSPEGAALFLGDKALGESPQIVTIPMASEPVTLTARFADGVEVVQTIVPDRPLPQVAFLKPKPQKAPEEKSQRPTKTVTQPAKSKPTNPGKLDDRDGTMDPFK
jgi:hypothetical protein